VKVIYGEFSALLTFSCSEDCLRRLNVGSVKVYEGCDLSLEGFNIVRAKVLVLNPFCGEPQVAASLEVETVRVGSAVVVSDGSGFEIFRR